MSPFHPNEGYNNAIVAVSHPRDITFNQVLGKVMELANEYDFGVIGGLDDRGRRWLKLTFNVVPPVVPPEGIEPSSLG